MSEYNIKISELNPVPSLPLTEDFFPLVHSQSMTTYRATLQNIGLLMTHSIYADTASISLFNPSSISASHANNADKSVSSSYALSALSASYTLVADSASWYPSQVFQSSALYASRSHDALYATRALDVDTHGTIYNIPYWNTANISGTNGALTPSSVLAVDPNQGLVLVDSASTEHAPYVGQYSDRPDFTTWRYNEQAATINNTFPNAGLYSWLPIVSQHFIGTDQRNYMWTGSTAHSVYDPQHVVTNSYFSGSAGGPLSGSFYTIPPTYGAIANVFNGKWVRIVSYGENTIFLSGGPGPSTAGHSSMGEFQSYYQNIGGLLRIECGSDVGNNDHIVYLLIHANMYSGQISAQVFHSSNYSAQIINAIRIYQTGGGPG